MPDIPAHVVSEAANDIYRRYSVRWKDVVAQMETPGFAIEPGATPLEMREAIYTAAEELLKRQGLA